MDLSSLEATFEQHRGPILVAAGGAVVVFALAKRKSGQAPTSGSTTAQTAAADATYSAGAQLAGTTGAAYDSTASDLYGAIQPQLEALQQQLSGGQGSTSPTPVPAPVASTLFAPAGTGNYVQYGNGLVAEVESDGSLLGVNLSQWQALKKKLGAGNWSLSQLSGRPPAGAFSIQQNLNRVAASTSRTPPTPVPTPYTVQPTRP